MKLVDGFLNLQLGRSFWDQTTSIPSRHNEKIDLGPICPFGEVKMHKYEPDTGGDPCLPLEASFICLFVCLFICALDTGHYMGKFNIVQKKYYSTWANLKTGFLFF